MNDDELAQALGRQLHEHTTDDAPSAALTRSLDALTVRPQHRPYLVPVGAAAAVTALATGGVLVAQLSGPAGGAVGAPASLAVSASASLAVSPSPSLGTSPIPAASGTAVSSAPSPSASAGAVSPSGPDPLTDPAKQASASPVPSKPVIPALPTSGPTSAASPSAVLGSPAPAGSADDSKALAGASAYSVTETTVTDPTLPDAATTHRVVTYRHDTSPVINWTWDQLAAMPITADAFRAAVKEPGQPPNAVEKGLQGLPLEGPLPTAQRKAAYEVATSMPGATVSDGVPDSLGRKATKVEIETDWMLDDYYFDPVSFRLLETASFNTPEWEAHWKPIYGARGETVEPLGSGFRVTYSDWTITP